MPRLRDYTRFGILVPSLSNLLKKNYHAVCDNSLMALAGEMDRHALVD